ncbi:MAG TPA: histidine kinase dimerization/phosphoacceptor domain-containing protein, partial [Glaciihabitans sp.]|nr:histidine kinase dimerization/phosphoacceptor domain-containing protein [Glaciihabitans sp.]
MFRILRPYQVAIDGAIALVYFFFATQLAVYGVGENLLVSVLTAALVLRRVSPGLSLALAWSAALAQMYAFDFPPSYSDLAILAVVYTSAAYGGRLVKWAGLASVGLGAILGSLYLVVSEQGFQFGFNFSTATVADLSEAVLQFAFLFIAMLVLLGLPWTAGLLVRTRIAARESKAAQLAAQREAEIAEQGVIVEQERNRIARDMHDVVAHSLAVVIAQADGARYARAGDPAAVDTALTAISSTARDALADVRLLLGQLRHSQAAGP